MSEPSPKRRRTAGGPMTRALALLTVLGGLLALAPEGGLLAAPPTSGETNDTSEASSSTSETRETPPYTEAFEGFMASLDAWKLDVAASRRDRLINPRERELATGLIAIYEARYPEAEAVLAGLVASTSNPEQDPVAARAAYYLDVARGAQLALGDATTLRSDDGRFEAVFADPRDELLAPYLFDAMATAYEVLGQDIGVEPDHPIRFEIYDDPGKLALVTPLTLDNIYTTGTVGICKYRRIMMISPRVMLYGYGWLDTAVHEYIHYLVTLRTNNNAPVWMQEGLAKLMEARWRSERRRAADSLSPTVRALLHDALERDELVTLEQMHPSVAMLPSQELAALAYAEAETMLGLLEEERGTSGLAGMLDDVAGGVDAKQAFATAWGSDFDSFFSEWKATMSARTGGASQGRGLPNMRFRAPDADAGSDPSLQGDVFSHLAGGRARKHARLGVLLTLRGHPEAAVLEYEKARDVDPAVREDPKLARRLGDLYLELDRAEDALPLLILAGEDDPDNPNIAAAEGRARLLGGDLEGADAALGRALRQNPFVPALHCDLAVLYEARGDDPERVAAERGLCME